MAYQIEFAEPVEEILILTANQEPVAAVISLKNVDKETLSLSLNPEFLAILENSRKAVKSGKRLSLANIKKEFYPSVDELREEKLYESAIRNPAFLELNEPEEDIYTLNDGKPFQDEP